MNIMRMIAKAGAYELVQHISGVVSLRLDGGPVLTHKDNAYDCIREIKNTEIRNAMLAQWSGDIVTCEESRRQARGGVRYHPAVAV